MKPLKEITLILHLSSARMNIFFEYHSINCETWLSKLLIIINNLLLFKPPMLIKKPHYTISQFI